MNNIKEIKDKLIEKYFNYDSKTVFLIEIENSNELIDLRYINLNSVYLVYYDKSMFFEISETGKLIFMGQYNQENRHLIKDTINEYLNKNVFNKIDLYNKLENNLKSSNKEKRSKI